MAYIADAPQQQPARLDLATQTKLTAQLPAQPQPVKAEIVPIEKIPLTVKELDATGIQRLYSVDFPLTLDFDQMTIAQKLWMMKAGPCAKFSIPMVVCLLAKTSELNALYHVRLEPGVDVYPTGEGRYGISNTAQIKIAQATGLIRSMEWSYSNDGEDEDLTCTVILSVRNLDKPITLTQRLGDWQRDTAPWKNQPRHMLLMNTLGHACKFIVPLANDHDTDITRTAPDSPDASSSAEPDLLPILEKSISAVQEGRALGSE